MGMAGAKRGLGRGDPEEGVIEDRLQVPVVGMGGGVWVSAKCIPRGAVGGV